VHRCIGTTRRRRTAASNARSNGREESSRPFVFRAPRPLFAGLECQNEPRAEICTRTSVQVAIGLFPIDSVRAEFLLLSLLFFAHSLHLPFTCTSRSFFSRSPPPLSLSRPHRDPHLPPFFCRFFFARPAFCNLRADEIKETLY